MPGKQVLFGALVETFGVLALLLLYVNREKLRNTSKGVITVIGIACGFIALACLVTYMALLPHCVLTSEVVEEWNYPVYFPLWLTGEAQRVVDDAGGRQGALDDAGPGAIEPLLKKMPNSLVAYGITTTLFLLLFLGFFTSVTVAFGVPGFHLADVAEQAHDGLPGSDAKTKQ